MKTSLTPLKPTPTPTSSSPSSATSPPSPCFRKRKCLSRLHLSPQLNGGQEFSRFSSPSSFSTLPSSTSTSWSLSPSLLSSKAYCLQKHNQQPQHKLFPGRDGQLEPLLHAKVNIEHCLSKLGLTWRTRSEYVSQSVKIIIYYQAPCYRSDDLLCAILTSGTSRTSN